MEQKPASHPLSADAFARLGLSEVVYVRPILIGKEKGYALCAADGHELGITPTLEAARTTAAVNDLQLVAVH